MWKQAKPKQFDAQMISKKQNSRSPKAKHQERANSVFNLKNMGNNDIKEHVRQVHGILKGSKLVGVDIDTFQGE